MKVVCEWCDSQNMSYARRAFFGNCPMVQEQLRSPKPQRLFAMIVKFIINLTKL